MAGTAEDPVELSGDSEEEDEDRGRHLRHNTTSNAKVETKSTQQLPPARSTRASKRQATQPTQPTAAALRLTLAPQRTLANARRRNDGATDTAVASAAATTAAAAVGAAAAAPGATGLFRPGFVYLPKSTSPHTSPKYAKTSGRKTTRASTVAVSMPGACGTSRGGASVGAAGGSSGVGARRRGGDGGGVGAGAGTAAGALAVGAARVAAEMADTEEAGVAPSPVEEIMPAGDGIRRPGSSAHEEQLQRGAGAEGTGGVGPTVEGPTRAGEVAAVAAAVPADALPQAEQLPERQQQTRVRPREEAGRKGRQGPGQEVEAVANAIGGNGGGSAGGMRRNGDTGSASSSGNANSYGGRGGGGSSGGEVSSSGGGGNSRGSGGSGSGGEGGSGMTAAGIGPSYDGPLSPEGPNPRPSALPSGTAPALGTRTSTPGTCSRAGQGGESAAGLGKVGNESAQRQRQEREREGEEGCGGSGCGAGPAGPSVGAAPGAQVAGVGELPAALPGLAWDPLRPGYANLEEAVKWREAHRGDGMEGLPRCWGAGLLGDRPVAFNCVLDEPVATLYNAVVQGIERDVFGVHPLVKLESKDLTKAQCAKVEKSFESMLRSAAWKRMNKEARGNHKSHNGLSAKEIIKYLPETLPCNRKVVVTRIGEGACPSPWDDVPEMHGQGSLLCIEDIKKAEILAPYASEFFLRIGWEAVQKTRPQEVWDDPHHPCPHASTTAFKHELGRYAADCTLPPALIANLDKLQLPAQLLHQLKGADGDTKFFTTAARLGCPMATANDPRSNMEATCEEDAGFREGGPNIALVTVTIMGVWPLPLMVAIKNIRSEKHAMYSYGYDYWDLHRQEVEEMQRDEAHRAEVQKGKMLREEVAQMRAREQQREQELGQLRKESEQLREQEQRRQQEQETLRERELQREKELAQLQTEREQLRKEREQLREQEQRWQQEQEGEQQWVRKQQQQGQEGRAAMAPSAGTHEAAPAAAACGEASAGSLMAAASARALPESPPPALPAPRPQQEQSRPQQQQQPQPQPQRQSGTATGTVIEIGDSDDDDNVGVVEQAPRRRSTWVPTQGRGAARASAEASHQVRLRPK